MGFWFKPKSGIGWTAQTRSTEMLDLVSRREAVFAEQRTYGQDEQAQAASRKILADHVPAGSVEGQLKRYYEFCEAVAIPPFPITNELIALFVFAKCSHYNGSYRSTVDLLNRFAKAIQDLWDAVEHAPKPDSGRQKQATIALDEFQLERKNVRIRRPTGGASVCDHCKLHSLSLSERAAIQWALSDFVLAASSFSSNRSAHSPDSQFDSSASEDTDDSASSHSGRPRARSSLTTTNGTIEQLPTPNLPQPGDRFSDFDELFSATYRALLPVYGMGARYHRLGATPVYCARSNHIYRDSADGLCDWKLGFTIDPGTKEHTVDAATSNFYHTHGPQPKLLKDPSFLPLIKNERVRRDLGMPPFRPRAAESSVPSASFSPSNSTPARSDSTPASSIDSTARPSKKPRLTPPAASAEDWKPTAYFAIPSVPRSTATPSSWSVQQTRAPASSSKPSPSLLAEALSTPVQAASFLPAPSRPSTHQPAAVTASTSAVTASHPAQGPRSLLPIVTDFLASFDVSLVPLARRFVEGRWITSVADLVDFCAFDDATRALVVDHVLEELALESGDDASLDLVRKGIVKLEEGLRASRASGWKF
ncbi:hypothetical protein JCM10212_003633 [Sporobolomyces blumeae]